MLPWRSPGDGRRSLRSVRGRCRVGDSAVLRTGACSGQGSPGTYADVFGLPIGIEGIFFFLEAIFLTIYLFGWNHLSPWAHFWSGAVLPFAAAGGAWPSGPRRPESDEGCAHARAPAIHVVCAVWHWRIWRVLWCMPTTSTAHWRPLNWPGLRKNGLGLGGGAITSCPGRTRTGPPPGRP